VTVHEQIPVNGRSPVGDERCSEPADVQSEDGAASGGDVTRTDLPLQLAAQIGRELQARWRAVRNDHRRFADLAVAVLEEFSPADQLTESGFDPVPDLPARLRMFLDAYGLADRNSILPALQRSTLISAGHVQDYPIGPADAAATLEYQARELRWLESAL